MDRCDQLLAGLLRSDWDPHAPASTAAWSEADWSGVVEAALGHGVGALACRAIAHLAADQVPAGCRDAAAVYLERSHEQGRMQVACLHDLFDALSTAGVPALAFKGPVLGQLAHASATIRPARDLDLLVRRRDMTRCVAALAHLGYALGETLPPAVMELYFDTYGQAILHAAGRTPVEPHFSFAPRALAVDLDMEALWQRAGTVPLAGRDVPTLSVADTMLAACLHGSKEKWWRLLWVADIAALVRRQPDLDWEALMREARGAGVLRMVLLGLALAQDIFATPLPAEVAGAIARDAACARLAQQSREHLFGSSRTVGSVNRLSRYHFRARERASDRARYVLRMLTTPGVDHYRMVTLPRPLAGGYVAIRLVHDYVLRPAWLLAKRRGRWREAPSP